ncbi:unnamed protein product [Orchesella dallaii]|uniref:ADP-ribosyl cyclase/cyclic ADP-ribose hydrolase n=1 Tax=Orchesella dallaii TaxID=48710 RepID=A0ABP1RAH8_9HEXA
MHQCHEKSCADNGGFSTKLYITNNDKSSSNHEPELKGELGSPPVVNSLPDPNKLLDSNLMVLHANNKMGDSDDLGSQGMNGQTMGILNGVQPTGNVQQSKAAQFSRINTSSTQSQHQTVNSSSRRVVTSALTSHHQSNETQTSQHVKQSSTQHLKSNLTEMQTRMSQMKAISQQTTSSTSSTSSSTSSSASATSSAVSVVGSGGKAGGGTGLPPFKLIDSKTGRSISEQNGGDDSPLDTGTVIVQEIPFPTSSDMQMTPVLNVGDMPNPPLESPNLVMNNHANTLDSPMGNKELGPQSFRFEQKKVQSHSSTKFTRGNFSTEQNSANAAEMKRVQTGDVSYEEKSSAQALRHKVEIDGITAEKTAALKHEQRSLTQGGVTEEESTKAAAASMKLSTDTFTAEKAAMAVEQKKQTRLAQGTIINSEKRTAAASQSKLTFKNQLALPCSTSNVLIFEDLDSLGWDSPQQDVDHVIDKYSNEISTIFETLRDTEDENTSSINHLNYASGVMKAAWNIPGHGHQVGGHLCEELRKLGGLDLLINNFNSQKDDLRVASARVLEQSLTPENCDYVVEKGFECLDKIVKVASELCEEEESPVGTGLLRHLFRHSETTCSDVLRLQGLERVMVECRRMDVETLRNCAGALVNLSLYGGADNQEAMIKKKVHHWLFPLAFHHDDSIKYYACLAIAVLVANKEIEAQIIKSNTLQLVEPFLNSHNPEEFGASNSFHSQGQSIQWLQRLVPVLSSQREEACSLAAFHFCMEAGIKKRQGITSVFKEIHAIEPLKRVASSPNALASKFAAQALKLIGETVPHKLSQQVPLWSTEDVREWVIQKGFDKYANSFMASRVDGDLLLQLTEDMLKDDIEMENGILRKRFMRDLRHLKKMADYSSCDPTNLNDFLSSIHPEYASYTYTLLNNHVDKDTLRKCVTEDVLGECGIKNSIDRKRILDALKEKSALGPTSEENPDKPLDVFISYRRSNGSQLASLLKVHLQLRQFSVFIDVERLEAGKFDNNLLHNIRQARHFVLVLTPNALDRCVEDTECKDWVHREIVAALNSQCNIIPIMDNFIWPDPQDLPEDIQPVLSFNGVKWIHDYQDACVDKLERFMRGETVASRDPIIYNGRNSETQSVSSDRASRPSPQYQRTQSVGSEGTRTE